MSQALAAGGPLWARPGDPDEQTLPLWRAALIALGIEIIVPFLLFGVDWSFLPSFYEPPPVPVMSVRLEEPPVETLPEPPPPEKKPQERPEPKRPDPLRNQVPVETPKPLPNEAPSKIELPKPQPKPEPKPKEEKKPEPEPEMPPLPSVFRDVKPVKKVKPKYPPEAEAQHIQGRVKVRLSVELDGSVSAAEILAAEPPGVFEESCLEAVRQYKFKRDGTTYKADQEIFFRIDE
jgi:protein TonB